MTQNFYSQKFHRHFFLIDDFGQRNLTFFFTNTMGYRNVQNDLVGATITYLVVVSGGW